MRAFSATLKPLERDVFTQTHASTLEGGCCVVFLLLATAVLVGFFQLMAASSLAVKLVRSGYSSGGRH